MFCDDSPVMVGVFVRGCFPLLLKVKEIEKEEKCDKLIDFTTGTLSIKRIINSHILIYIYIQSNVSKKTTLETYIKWSSYTSSPLGCHQKTFDLIWLKKLPIKTLLCPSSPSPEKLFSHQKIEAYYLCL